MKVIKSLLLLAIMSISVVSAQAAVINPTERLNSAEQFLQGLDNNLDNYDNQVITTEYTQVLTIAEDKNQSPEIRSRAYVLYSGIIGLYSKKNKSSSAGKKSFEALKKAIILTPKSESAVTVYASVVLGMSSHSLAKRKIIEATMKIDLQTEQENAIKLLKSIPPTAKTTKLLQQLNDLKNS